MFSSWSTYVHVLHLFFTCFTCFLTFSKYMCSHVFSNACLKYIVHLFLLHFSHFWLIIVLRLVAGNGHLKPNHSTPLHSEAIKEPEIAICRMAHMKHRLKHIETLRDSKRNTFKPVERILSFCRWSNFGPPCYLTTLGQRRQRQGRFERGRCLHEWQGRCEEGRVQHGS